jgi:hypothetical protein
MLPKVWMARGRARPWPATGVFGCRCSTAGRAQHTMQMLLAEDDHMIKALASDRADRSFGIAVLPWRSRRCRSVANAHRSDAARKCLSVDPVSVPDEVLRRALPTTCLRDLLGDPFGSRMRCDGEPQNAPSIVSED